MEEQEKTLSEIAVLMFVLNAAIILFYSLVCFATARRVCASFNAYGFLSAVRQMPRYPWAMPVQSVTLYLLLCSVSFGKTAIHRDRRRVRLAVCLTEIALCLGVTASLNFYYSGAALLVLADLVRYARGGLPRILVMPPLILLFALGQYEIISLPQGKIPFTSWLSYYSQPFRSYLSGVESLMATLNILLFVLYMVLLFTSQKQENARIRRLNEQLNQANTRLREYTFELERMTEVRERNRLAREIHDTLGHTLTGIIMGADAAAAMLDTAPEAARKGLGTIASTAREGLDDVRRSIKALRPDALEQHSLEEALEKLIHNFHLTTSADIRFRQDAGPLRFARDEEDTFYRIIQEGMTNAVRHGHATEIEIQITRQEDLVTLHLRDNGLGCDDPEEGFGLAHMRERLGLLGGSLTYGNRNIDSDDEHRGFFIAASLPIREREDREDYGEE